MPVIGRTKGPVFGGKAVIVIRRRAPQSIALLAPWAVGELTEGPGHSAPISLAVRADGPHRGLFAATTRWTAPNPGPPSTTC